MSRQARRHAPEGDPQRDVRGFRAMDGSRVLAPARPIGHGRARHPLVMAVPYRMLFSPPPPVYWP